MTTDIQAFVALVREYRAVVDGADDRAPHALLRRCAVLLPRIYAAGLELPDVEPETESVDTRTIESPMRRLGALLGQYDSYLEIFDPYEEGEQVRGLISDDLADVYLDLVEPLAAFESGRVQDAVWSWKLSIRGHCGDHIVDTMRAVHRLIHLHMPEEYVASDRDAG
jgi:hypothetical protein